ncbi:MAG: hypothetical protein A3E84_00590 [Gammaproteobacteria bacterium RIFCSPHIGHO2_12_FULL_42_13]|nr:MAG: hypothetical protein A3E84_00590 [Gammaproteobacteria bacterium RIFCSPHIGHO2_12_FULL_42_13]
MPELSHNAYRWLLSQLTDAKRYLMLTALFTILAGGCMIIQAFSLATVLDRVFIHHAIRNNLLELLIIFLCTVIARSFFLYWRELFAEKTAVRVKTKIRKKYIKDHCGNPALNAGIFSTTVINHVEALHGFFSNYLPQLMTVAILPAIILMVLFFQNWLIGLMLLCSAPLVPLFMAFIGIKAAAQHKKHTHLVSSIHDYFLDRIQGLSTLLFFGQATAGKKSVVAAAKKYQDSTLRVLKIAFLSSATLEFFATLAIAMTAIYLGLGLLGFISFGFSGTMPTLQKTLFILLLAPELFASLKQLGNDYHAKNEAIGAANIILETTCTEKKNDIVFA